jgi:hypothetical protein
VQPPVTRSPTYCGPCQPSTTQISNYGGPVQPSATQSPNYGGPLQPLVMVSSASMGHRIPLAPNTQEYGGSRMNSSHTVLPGEEGGRVMQGSAGARKTAAPNQLHGGAHTPYPGARSALRLQPTAQHRPLPPPLGLAAMLDSRICVMKPK